MVSEMQKYLKLLPFSHLNLKRQADYGLEIHLPNGSVSESKIVDTSLNSSLLSAANLAEWPKGEENQNQDESTTLLPAIIEDAEEHELSLDRLAMTKEASID